MWQLEINEKIECNKKGEAKMKRPGMDKETKRSRSNDRKRKRLYREKITIGQKQLQKEKDKNRKKIHWRIGG